MIIPGKKRGVKAWKCDVCGAVIKGDTPPETCPVCGKGPEHFIEVTIEEIEFSSSADLKFVIIGGGIAGLTAADEIRKRNDVAGIEIISDEDVVCYNRPMLTKGLLAEPESNEFYVQQPNWYGEKKIKTTLGVSAVSIDAAAKTVALSNGETREYDKLIYAAGSECNVIPIPGADKDIVKVIRKIADVHAIQTRLDEIDSVAVIGGGVLGLEAGWELARAGKKVTILQNGGYVMNRQLDRAAAETLQAAAEKSGVTIITGAKTKEITDSGVTLEDGEVEAQLVIISAGTVPNVKMAFDAGLKGDRFIEVDSRMRTSDPDIYAAGDCAAFTGVSYGLWNQSLDQGRIAGINAVGDDEEYEHIVPAVAFTGFGIEVFAVGDVGTGDREYKVEEKNEPDKNICRRLYTADGVLTGGIAINDENLGVKIMDAYKNKKDLHL